MNLKKLLEGCDLSSLPRDADLREITGISSDSRNVKKGHIYVCLRGTRYDGHDFAAEAVRRGASAVLAERELCGVDNVILTDDTRRSLSVIWNNFYGDPTRDMLKIAITATAGNTTCAYLLRYIFQQCGYRVGMISTVETTAGDETLTLGSNGGASLSDVDASLTTPDPEYFFSAAYEMKTKGCEVLIYEASSQSLLYKKTSAITPDIAIFTNISHEHLDCHGNMEEYLRTKASLLKGVKTAVINCDDSRIATLPQAYPDTDFVRCSADPARVADTDVTALRSASLGLDGMEYVYFSDNAVFRVKTAMIGTFSISNTLLCAASFVPADPCPHDDRQPGAGQVHLPLDHTAADRLLFQRN